MGHRGYRALFNQDQRRAAKAGAGHPGTQTAGGAGGVNHAVQLWAGYLEIITWIGQAFQLLRQGLSQARNAQLGRGPLSATPACSVLAIDDPVRCVGADDEQNQSSGVQIQRNLPHRLIPAIEQQGVACGAAQGCELVHPAGGRADNLVLSAAACLRELYPPGACRGQPEPAQGIDRERDRGGPRQQTLRTRGNEGIGVDLAMRGPGCLAR